ncbi:unnamed protein product [Cylindrotheca closterium]|uniref:Peptidase S1 domain-containing protein n=1 Tax=Cylindrotheca closterium TaxID=2856 RepID=A0AAD2G6W5_9STRA|nr:unnamed protein product [Cylindrotheca closterium]
MKFLSLAAVALATSHLAEAHDVRTQPGERTSHTKERVGIPKTKTVGAIEDRGEANTREHTTTRVGTPKTKTKTAERIDDSPSLIVGGSSTTVGEFPYYVDLDGCGGSLIAPGVVLTAAHCEPDRFSYVGKTVIVGGHKRQQVTDSAVSATVTKSISHPLYNPNDESLDIMLIQLDIPVVATGSISLALNANSSSPVDGQMLTVVGNGDTREDGNQSDELLQVDVPAVNTDVCNGPYEGDIVDEVMFCAGGGSQDSCQGDSGGPIVVQSGSTHTQVGVVSWGIGCAPKDFPGVYARVSSAMNFIAYVTCNCFGVNDPSICSSLDRNDNFSCDQNTGGSFSGGNFTEPDCELIPGWADEDNYGCAWYEEQELDENVRACEQYANITDSNGDTPVDACCVCNYMQSSGSSNGTNGSGAEPPCELIPGWADEDNYGCAWYEEQELDENVRVCEQYANITDSNGDTPVDACCVCDYLQSSGSSGGTNGTGAEPPCELIAGWADEDNYGCAWYEEQELDENVRACEQYANITDSNGDTPVDACCVCNYMQSSGSSGGTNGSGAEPPCELIPGWADEDNYGCAWYEEQELDENVRACEQYANITDSNGDTPVDACCVCNYMQSSGSSGGTNGTGAEPPCELIAGWADEDNYGCAWYEEQELDENVRACEQYANITDSNGNTPFDACCVCDYLQSSGSSGGTNGTGAEPPCENIPGWTDVTGDGCEWYEYWELEENEPVCEDYSDGTDANGISPIDACCVCDYMVS